ncbi:Fpg/Nei family DNA glycosylase [Nakamurella endophytica]|uniref:Endonuclease 8 1 n=1 Tax=Nakamurella endophytica TaxID=1748367 RepID=A0A917SWV8_9ACTN|nr:Fpg/Nei family DNA glycosylase [Nakamurella endophytica]GGM00330.1 endonuclease VIII [Nakamurella endophytica]
MPEGHTLHRLAREHQRLLAGHTVHASSPQGRFTDGAAMIDGRVLRSADAWGKHLFHDYGEDVTLHVHLGLYGKFTAGTGEPPEPRGALRLRLVADDVWTDLRGATACELLEPPQVDALLARLGPDPLRPRSDPEVAWRRLSRSRVVIAALLMDQSVLAGIGNVYRAEILFRHRVDPFAPGRSIDHELWQRMWADLVVLMRAGVRSGRIVTVDGEYRPRRRGPLTREESVFVYRRTGEPCRVCGTPVRTQVLVGRNLFWCPNCQRP